MERDAARKWRKFLLECYRTNQFCCYVQHLWLHTWGGCRKWFQIFPLTAWNIFKKKPPLSYHRYNLFNKLITKSLIFLLCTQQRPSRQYAYCVYCTNVAGTWISTLTLVLGTQKNMFKIFSDRRSLLPMNILQMYLRMGI